MENIFIFVRIKCEIINLLIMKKLPPVEKIYEAFSAIADQRITMGEDHALVKSSDFTKEYTVRWDGRVYFSDDNASYWQGYAGYPVIAVLMMQHILPLNLTIAGYFKGINWKLLNNRYKSKYDMAVNEVMDDLSEKNVDVGIIRKEVGQIFDTLCALDIQIVRPRKSGQNLKE